MLKFLVRHRIQLMLFVFVFTAGRDRCFGQNTGPLSGQQPPPSIESELDAMRKRIDELEAELKNIKAKEAPSVTVTSAKATAPPPSAAPAPVAPAPSVAAAATKEISSSTDAAETTPSKIAQIGRAHV